MLNFPHGPMLECRGTVSMTQIVKSDLSKAGSSECRIEATL